MLSVTIEQIRFEPQQLGEHHLRKLIALFAQRRQAVLRARDAPEI